MHRPLLAALAALTACAALSSSARADALLVTDASWKVSASAPADASWKSAIGFDDSGWNALTVLFDVPSGTPGVTGAAIWSGAQYAHVPEAYGRRVFDLAELPLSATLQGAFDDDGDVYLNGQLIISNHDGLAGNVGPVDISSYLVLGDNLLAFAASDNFQGFGDNHQAWLQIDGKLAAPSTLPEPASAGLVLLGLGLAAWRSGKRGA